MNRRGFFGLLAASAAVAVTAELAELLAPKRTIFLPPVGGWLSSRGLLRYTEFYDIERNHRVCRHDLFAAGEQIGVDQILSPNNEPEQALKTAWLMFGHAIEQRGLALADLSRVPIIAGWQSRYV